MKKYIGITAISLLCSAMLLSMPFFDSCANLSRDVMRIHILAASDSAADQSLKLCVRDRIVGQCSAYYEDCASKEEAMEVTRERLGEIEAAAADEIRRRGFCYPVRAEVGEAYFNTRYYDDFTMPAGWYDSLRVIIGDGEGGNWWCVLYPSLCVGAAGGRLREQLDSGEYRVVTADRLDCRFKIVEVFEDIAGWFR